MLLVFIVTLLYFFLPSQRLYVCALKNVTVDETSSMIAYSGMWTTAPASSLNFGGSHKVSVDILSGRATFTFTGVAVYYMASLWGRPISSQLSLDGAPAVHIDLTGPLSVGSFMSAGQEVDQAAPRWAATGLSNSQHTIVVSVATDTGFAIVDGFIITVDDGSSSSAQTARVASPGPSSESRSSSAQSSPKSQSSTEVSNAPATSAALPPSASSVQGQISSTRSFLTASSGVSSISSTPTNTSTSVSPPSKGNSDTGDSNGDHVLIITLAAVLPVVAITLLGLGWWLRSRSKKTHDPSPEDEQSLRPKPEQRSGLQEDTRIPVPFLTFDSAVPLRDSKRPILPPNPSYVSDFISEPTVSGHSNPDSPSSYIYSASERRSLDSAISFYGRWLADPPGYEA